MRNIASLVLLLACSETGAAPDGGSLDAGADGAADIGTLDASADARDAPSTACTEPGWGPIDEAVATGMSMKLDQAVLDLDLPGAAMALADSGEHTLWAGAAGYSRVETSEVWAPERAFRIGSVSKTYTAALIWLLIEEGAITLADPVERWVPGYFDGLGVTLRHLLSMTSGIVSYNYVGSFDDSAPWVPIELVQWAHTHEPDLRFEPGSMWEYSNTNMVLLGLVVEAATGNSFEEELQTRLLDPLCLRDTYMAGTGDDNPAVVDAYGADGENLSDAADPSFGWSAGGMVATPSDLARWGAALFGGRVLRPSSLEQMVTQTVLADGTVAEYGLGAFVEQDGTDALWGHTGGIAGYSTYLYYYPPEEMALVVMTNELGTNLRNLAGYGWSSPLGLDFP